MNETSLIRPWQPAQAPKITTRPQPPVQSEADERLMLARLFGKDTASVPANSPVTPPRSADDEFASNLGRHLDVLA
jgi:hypothetical protein